MKKIAILSGKFSIGLTSHLEAYYELINEAGYEAFLLINTKYEKYIRKYKNIFSLKDINNLVVDCLIIFNISLYDKKIIKLLKKYNADLKVVLVYHEPWRGLRNEIKRQKTYSNILKTIGRKILANSLLKKVDRVWLPSKEAERQYKKIDYNINNNYDIFPLIFRDELDEKINTKNKIYFSYIATVAPSRRFNEYLSFIKKYATIDKNMKFMIATSSNIVSFLDKDLNNLIDTKRLIVKHNYNLTNKEINEAYYKSIAVWLVYKESTQSGVLCKSFMNGTPVIASNIEAFREYINNNNNSIIVENFEDNKIKEALTKIYTNLDFFSKNARDDFLKLFYYKSNIALFKEKIKDLK